MYAMGKDLASMMRRATELVCHRRQGPIEVLRSSYYAGVRASLTAPMPTDPPVVFYGLHPAGRPRPDGSWQLVMTVRKRPWRPYDLDEVRRLVTDMDIDADPKDIRRGMLTPEERDLYALLPPSTVRWLLDRAGIPRAKE